ncbi:ribbon-helix-helix domain-containing protein [Rufibacter hautae]|uniref:hypothetical protein n=1 Tax=Rufibacter hautae TaxID=2595005 RepID=UPI0016809D9E|nr:hypothetical protein [Rufibacter hautae]
MPEKLAKKETYIPVTNLPEPVKNEFLEMCKDLGYNQTEYIRHVVRRDVQKWKEKKAA